MTDKALEWSGNRRNVMRISPLCGPNPSAA
jgi:hypothetical protein